MLFRSKKERENITTQSRLLPLRIRFDQSFLEFQMEQRLWLGHASFLQGNDVPSILHHALPKQSSPDNNISGILFKIIRPKEQLKASQAVSTWLFFFCSSFSFM